MEARVLAAVRYPCIWRNRRDLNPWSPYGLICFRDRPFQPLTHYSTWRKVQDSNLWGPCDPKSLANSHHRPLGQPSVLCIYYISLLTSSSVNDCNNSKFSTLSLYSDGIPSNPYKVPAIAPQIAAVVSVSPPALTANTTASL